MQQQQPPRDPIAQMQQMSGSCEFQQQGGSLDHSPRMSGRRDSVARDPIRAEREQQSPAQRDHQL